MFFKKSKESKKKTPPLAANEAEELPNIFKAPIENPRVSPKRLPNKVEVPNERSASIEIIRNSRERKETKLQEQRKVLNLLIQEPIPTNSTETPQEKSKPVGHHQPIGVKNSSRRNESGPFKLTKHRLNNSYDQALLEANPATRIVESNVMDLSPTKPKIIVASKRTNRAESQRKHDRNEHKSKSKPKQIASARRKAADNSTEIDVFSRLSPERQESLFKEAAKLGFQRVADTQRVFSFARVLANGLEMCHQLKREKCSYLPLPVTLPKQPPSEKEKPTLFIEPIYTLALLEVSNNNEGKPVETYYLRPGAVEFLNKVSESWEIVLYSSRKKANLKQLVDQLDPERYNIAQVLDRSACAFTEEKKCVKDLKHILKNRQADKCIIVDYKPQNCALCMDHMLLVMHWNGSPQDQELEGLQKYLSYLALEDHPRKVNQANFNYLELWKTHISATNS